MDDQQKRLQLSEIQREAEAIEKGSMKESVRNVADRIGDRAETLLEEMEE